MYKSIVLHERRKDFTRAQFMNHWLTTHAPMSQGTDHLFGYVCHEVVDDVTPSSAPVLLLDAAVDGIAQMWFEKPDGLLTLPQQPHVKKWFSDGPNFIGRRMRFIGEEHVVASPRRKSGKTHKLIIFVDRSDDADEPEKAALVTALTTLNANHSHWSGFGVSHILSNHPTATIVGFPMAPVDEVIEVWLDQPKDAAEATEEIIGAISEMKIQLSGIRAFLTEETVIQFPST